MSIVESSAQFIGGLQNIERGIIAGVREAGGQLHAGNFRWHRGKDLLPVPNGPVELEVKAQGKTFNAVLSREEAEDSWQGISRPDIVAIVDAAVAQLTKVAARTTS